MSEPTTPENENAGQTLAPVSLFCGCSEFREAQQSCTDNEGYGRLIREWGGEWRIGSDLPAMNYCPWCGNRVPQNADISHAGPAA